MNRLRCPIRALILPRAAAAATSPSSPPPRRTLTTATAAQTFSLKNVTISNFAATLPPLLRQIKSADFVAVDLEMTGVTSAPWRESFEFDRHDVQYLKVKDSAEKFAVVQFGVCPFRWDKGRGCFVAYPHNFYVFPRKGDGVDGPAYEFLCQTTSIDFLARYRFDFNACIRDGVSYLSRAQEQEALCRLKSAYDNESKDALDDVKANDVSKLSIPDILFTERMKIRFNDWRDGLMREGNAHLSGSSTHSKDQLETIFFKMRPALSLKEFTSHKLRLIQSVVKQHFKDLVFIRAYGENSTIIKLIVYIESDKDKKDLLREVNDGIQAEATRKIKEAVGFRQVIDILSMEKKLLVGHNCFLDVAHIYSKFIGQLPSTLEEYVSEIHKLFPNIIDTKVLLNSNAVLQKLVGKTRTSLSSAFSLLCPDVATRGTSSLAGKTLVKVEVQVDDMRSSNWNSGDKHEAGYDAFMTGCVFAQACSHLVVDFQTHSPPSEVAENEKLRGYANLLYLSWSSGDIINLTTGAAHTGFLTLNTHKKQFFKILHDNIVLIWGLQSNLKANQIKECICKVFGFVSVTSVYHLDPSAVFVQFTKTEYVSNFLELKERLETGDDAISVLHPFSKLLEGGNTCAAGYEVYKEICSSPISKVLFADQAEAVGIKWKTRLIEQKKQVESKDAERSGEKSTNISSVLEGIIESRKAGRSTLKTTSPARNKTCSGLDELVYGSETQQEFRASS
ncbi:hypothetical protein Droror1_Dr00014678 [Drosera rotundifolia]